MVRSLEQKIRARGYREVERNHIFKRECRERLRATLTKRNVVRERERESVCSKLKGSS